MRVELEEAGGPGCLRVFWRHPRVGVLENDQNSPRCVWHLTRGFTPFRTGSVRLLEVVRRGGV